jgi:hypothetical protein
MCRFMVNLKEIYEILMLGKGCSAYVVPIKDEWIQFLT